MKISDFHEFCNYGYEGIHKAELKPRTVNMEDDEIWVLFKLSIYEYSGAFVDFSLKKLLRSIQK